MSAPLGLTRLFVGCQVTDVPELRPPSPGLAAWLKAPPVH